MKCGELSPWSNWILAFTVEGNWSLLLWPSHYVIHRVACTLWNSPNHASNCLGCGDVAQLDLFALLSLGVAVQNNDGLASTKHDCSLQIFCSHKFNKLRIPNDFLQAVWSRNDDHKCMPSMTKWNDPQKSMEIYLKQITNDNMLLNEQSIAHVLFTHGIFTIVYNSRKEFYSRRRVLSQRLLFWLSKDYR